MIIELDKNDKSITIKSDICLMCGHKFSKSRGKEKLFLSMHHSIPGKMKPVFNVKIPLHVKCHEKLNSKFMNKSEFVKMENKVKSLYASFLKIRKGEKIDGTE